MPLLLDVLSRFIRVSLPIASGLFSLPAQRRADRFLGRRRLRALEVVAVLLASQFLLGTGGR